MPQQVKIVNDLIIDPKTKFASKEHIRLQSFAKRRMPGVVYQDLFDDDNGGSLKDKEGLLGLSVLESEVDFNTENMMQEQKDDMTYYCKHDVYSTMEYFVRIREVNQNLQSVKRSTFRLRRVTNTQMLRSVHSFLVQRERTLQMNFVIVLSYQNIVDNIFTMHSVQSW